MNVAETTNILGILKVAYAKVYGHISEEDAEQMIMFWSEMFENDDFNQIKAAVKDHVNTSKWPPSIAEIREKLVKTNLPELTETAGEAWGQVLPKLSNPGRADPEGGMRHLSEVAKQCCRNLGWANLCNSQDIKWERERFIKMYDQLKDIVSCKVAQGQSIYKAIGVAPPKEQKLLEAPTPKPIKKSLPMHGPKQRVKTGAERCREIKEMLKGIVGASERKKGER